MNDRHGFPTSKTALAQEYWLRELTPEQRLDIVHAVASPDMTIDMQHAKAMRYVIDHLLTFSVDGDVLTATPTPYQKPLPGYETYYTPWMKHLAKCSTRAELETRLYGTVSKSIAVAKTGRTALQRTTSMQSQSQARAHAANVCAAVGDEKIALAGALEIYDRFPEHTKEGGL